MVSLDRSCVLITQQMIQIVLLRLKIFTADRLPQDITVDLVENFTPRYRVTAHNLVFVKTMIMHLFTPSEFVQCRKPLF